MELNIYQFSDYKDYLCKKVIQKAKKTKGLKSKLSEFLQCHPSHLSQVLKKDTHLTLEQGQRINRFFPHNKEESKYFLLLLQKSRAGTEELKDFFDEQITELQENKHNLKLKLKNTQNLDEAQHSKYYSSWFYSAIHVILSISEYQDPKKIAMHFRLPIDLVLEVIDFLENAGLIVESDGRWEVVMKHLFLGRNSDYIQKHHINWRSQSLQSVEKNLKEDLHYSNVIALSNKDLDQVKDIFFSAIEGSRHIIRDSKEETIAAITLDVFNL